MREEDGRHHLIALVKQVLGSPPDPLDTAPVEGETADHQEASEAKRSVEASEVVVMRKEKKTAAELATMIENDLAQHPECPAYGFHITVYGATHWRAMLTITPAAGGLRNAQEWRDLTEDLASRLRSRYDLAWEV